MWAGQRWLNPLYAHVHTHVRMRMWTERARFEHVREVQNCLDCTLVLMDGVGNKDGEKTGGREGGEAGRGTRTSQYQHW